MTTLVPPSEALSQVFILPKVTVENTAPFTPAQPSTLVTYGVPMGNFGLLLPTRTAGRIVSDLTLRRLPNAAHGLLGMASLNGSVVPIFDISTLLELTPEGHRGEFLVIGEGATAVGFTITSQPLRLRLEPGQRINHIPPLPALLQPHARACYRLNDCYWIEWDVDAFFYAAGRCD